MRRSSSNIISLPAKRFIIVSTSVKKFIRFLTFNKTYAKFFAQNRGPFTAVSVKTQSVYKNNLAIPASTNLPCKRHPYKMGADDFDYQC